MRIVALGRGRLLSTTIAALRQQDHQITMVATCPENAESHLTEQYWTDLALSYAADHLHCRSLNSSGARQRLINAKADVAVSVNWMTLIDRDTCAIFPHGILNAHGGDLPRYRGNAPFAWAILNGEPTVGITIHAMDPDELDAGPVYLKRFVPVGQETYVGHLYDALNQAIPEMFVEALAGIAAGTLHPQVQVGTPLRGYSRRPEDAFIDWQKPALYLSRLVRASAEPFPGAFTFYGKDRLTIWRADVVGSKHLYMAIPGQVLTREPNGPIEVATGDGVLRVTEIERDGSGRAVPASVIQSTRDRLG